MRHPFATFVVNGLLAALAVLSLAPLLWMLSVSFMQAGEATHFPPPLLPSAPTLHNYHELFARAGMGRYLFNSFLVSGCVTLLALLFNTMAGYAFAKLRFSGREVEDQRKRKSRVRKSRLSPSAAQPPPRSRGC